MFPKIVGFPAKSSILIGVFHYFHHPFLGVLPLFLDSHPFQTTTQSCISLPVHRTSRHPFCGFNFWGFDLLRCLELTSWMGFTGDMGRDYGWAQRTTPWKINGWNIIPWRFGRSFSFLNGWLVGSMLIFQGVVLNRVYWGGIFFRGFSCHITPR